MDPGSGMGKNQDPDPGSRFRMNTPDHISESSLEIFFFGVKILKFFDADPGSGMEKIQILYPGCQKFRSGINIPIRNTEKIDQ
jgi:hypothetical protein